MITIRKTAQSYDFSSYNLYNINKFIRNQQSQLHHNRNVIVKYNQECATNYTNKC